MYKLDIIVEYKNKKYLNILIEDVKSGNFYDDKNTFFLTLYNNSFPMKSIFYTKKQINIDDDLSYKIELIELV